MSTLPQPPTMPSPEVRLERGAGGAGPLFRIRGLSHWFGTGEARKQVLYENNLEVMPGEMVIMTGKSGSGKTTLLTLIGALRKVQQGSLQVLGREVTGLNAGQLVELRQQIGFIFQAHNLFDSLSAYQNVCLALQLRTWPAGAMHSRAVELLTALGLEDRLHYKPGKLSGGQRQRVAIARALGNHPRLILADEPTAALDEESATRVVQMLRREALEKGAAILIVTHDPAVLDAADRVINMSYGRIILDVRHRELSKLVEYLKHYPGFAGLGVEKLTHLAETMSRETFEPGTVIVRQGEGGARFYLLSSGTVEVVVDHGLPTQWQVKVLKEGEFFGETPLLTGLERSATVVSRDQVAAYSLDKAHFETALAASQSLKDHVYKTVFLPQ